MTKASFVYINTLLSFFGRVFCSFTEYDPFNLFSRPPPFVAHLLTTRTCVEWVFEWCDDDY
jgi:hypothetical protein